MSLYDCTPPDSEGHLGAIGCFVLPGSHHDSAQVADSHSPAFIQDQKQCGLRWNETTQEWGDDLLHSSLARPDRRSLIANC
jgi:hypothetical protein